ncbi:tyrosine-type recombinase/integrase [Fictibacillus sp. 26RED30]|uniref:tyrosine-type recombinase/integrase n=1 Tax=Fictibacillus sp. 26RED30 TaxID=2745877 RepID=UPI0018CDDC85|nr:tyrosine-type recombinase/integrase [Fictibacillus sp. 26RED30]MBH0162082.1 site-specific integrase [Fictibacillus sp. 26RED30]
MNKRDYLEPKQRKTILPTVIDEEYLDELKKNVSFLGNFHFDDNTWYCEKLHIGHSNKQNGKLYFNRTPQKYREIVKIFALVNDKSVTTRAHNISYLNKFFEYLETVNPNYTINEVNEDTIAGFTGYLIRNNFNDVKKKHSFNAVKSFFNTLAGYPGVPNIIFGKKHNPFKIDIAGMTRDPIKKEDINKLDELLFDFSNEIPLVTRVHYWTMRLFPNRVDEVSSMQLDCLIGHFNHFILRIPTWKINGGHVTPEFKAITLSYQGIIKTYVDMIKKLQSEVKEMHKYIKVGKGEIDLKQFLFIHQPFKLFTNESGEICVKWHRNKSNYYVYSNVKANAALKQITSHLDIKDSDITTHRFRHNSVTQRADAGYTSEQIMFMTGHKSKAMLDVYKHSSKERLKNVYDAVTNQLNPVESSPVIFSGKIINMNNPVTEKVLIKQGVEPYLVKRLKKPGETMGVCSQVAVTQCSPDGTPIKYECYACNWFVPIADKYEEYKEDMEFWANISERSKNNVNQLATYENASRNMALLRRIVNICERGIEKHKQDVLNNIQFETYHKWN